MNFHVYENKFLQIRHQHQFNQCKLQYLVQEQNRGLEL